MTNVGNYEQIKIKVNTFFSIDSIIELIHNLHDVHSHTVQSAHNKKSGLHFIRIDICILHFIVLTFNSDTCLNNYFAY